MTYGAGVLGVSDSELRNMRSATVGLLSDATVARSTVLQLMLADKTERQKTDPLFAASAGPIEAYATEVWNG
eukprot:7054462-Karenia_brevis.AAC.1